MLAKVMLKYRHLLIAVAVILLLFGGFFYFSWYTQQKNTILSEKNIDGEPDLKKKFGYTCEVGKSAFEVLDERYNVVSSESSFGKLVTVINGVSQTNGKYWLYSIDGKEATVGASAYTCQGEERIEWELK